ncbi:hypothetical protein E2C01_060625 [Portunus trituberculatus]|uniref:Uncharacterized protein n=1 Tax=Portunus trituberculatus TaxID=210409 RepID=A0A5B7HB04_PORTR|nr:hypothetical protein [Portunus trituberculatus]
MRCPGVEMLELAREKEHIWDPYSEFYSKKRAGKVFSSSSLRIFTAVFIVAGTLKVREKEHIWDPNDEFYTAKKHEWS